MTQHKLADSDPEENNALASSQPPRRLLNLQAGDRKGLARAFGALIGRPPELLPTLALETLQMLGFERHPDGFSHPLAPERYVAFTLPEQESDPENAALKWAIRHFREIEFYLPYISLIAKRQKKLAKAGKRDLSPEPDYDEDGFLINEI